MSLRDLALLVALALGLAGAATLGLMAFAAWTADRSWKRRQRRLERLALAAAELESRPDVAARLAAATSPTPRLDAWLHRVPGAAALEAGLARTGRSFSLGQFAVASLAVAALAALGLAVASPLPALAAIAAGLGAGALLPRLVVARWTARRRARFTAQFPAAIELIVRALRAGLPLTEAIHTVGAEFPDPAGGEFRRVAGALALGFSIEDALWGAVRRIDTPELRFFIVSIATQRQTGGNLGETLTNLADVLRARASMRLKIKAMTGEARASAAVLGGLPFAVGAMIFVTTPGYLDPLFTDPRGWLMLGAGAVSLTVGLGIMAKLIRFEI